MNKERILLLADTIERSEIPDLGFNMGFFLIDDLDFLGIEDMSGHNCGTVGCIAGWGRRLMCKLGEGVSHDPSFWRVREWLDLSSEQKAELFYAYHWLGSDEDRNLCQITPDHAVRTLRHLAETGEVRW